MRVLVLAPAFPSLSQAWMDTYLLMLQRKGIAIQIATTVSTAATHHPMMDKHALLDRTKRFNDTPAAVLHRILITIPARVFSFPSVIRRTYGHLKAISSTPPSLGNVLRSVAAGEFFRSLPRPDVVHAHSLYMAYSFSSVLAAEELPLVITFHGQEPSGSPQLAVTLQCELMERAALVIVNTQAALEQLRSIGFRGDNVAVIPQVVSLETFPFLAKPAPKPGAVLNVLTVGRLHQDKGQHYALLALARLHRSGVAVHWHLVGAGPFESRLRKLASFLGVDHLVTFHGAVSSDQVSALHRKCHIHVLPSLGGRSPSEWSETLGVANLEAQASGCIVVSTATGGIPECVFDEVNGLLVQERSHRSIAGAIVRLLQDPDLWRRLQTTARSDVVARFSEEAVSSRLIPALTSLVQRRHEQH